MARTHHVVDYLGNTPEHLLRHYVLQLEQEFILQTVDGEIGNKSEHEYQQRRQCHQHGVGKAFGPLPYLAVGGTLKKQAHHVVDWHLAEPRERYVIQIIKHSAHLPLV